MIMVVLGAGASYDSNPTYSAGRVNTINEVAIEENRIPLANQLFENRTMFNESLARFPQCHPIVPYLRKTTSIERILQGFLDQSTTDPKRLIQLAAVRYYLHVMLTQCERNWLNSANHITTHLALLDQLRYREREGICFVTFNYDTLIEHSLNSVDVHIATMNDYVSNDCYKLIKLHGSVNWAHMVRTELVTLSRMPLGSGAHYEVASEMINRAHELSISNEYRIVADCPMTFVRETYSELYSDRLEQREKTVGVFPAIAIPIQTKEGFECPSDHIRALEQLMPNIDKILVIGWRGTEKPFLKMLSDSLGVRQQTHKCFVVSDTPENLNTTIENIRNAGVNAQFGGYPKGFTPFVLSRQLESIF